MRPYSIFAPVFATWLTSTAAFQAYMTFNNFPSQKSVACGTNPGDNIGALVFSAAASDNSPDLFQGSCNYSQQDLSQDPSQWYVFVYRKMRRPPSTASSRPRDEKLLTTLNSPEVQAGTYSGPSCSNTLCGACFKVTNGDKSITVRIVDACPKYHAQNYCKTGPQYTDEDRCAAADDQ